MEDRITLNFTLSRACSHLSLALLRLNPGWLDTGRLARRGKVKRQTVHQRHDITTQRRVNIHIKFDDV